MCRQAQQQALQRQRQEHERRARQQNTKAERPGRETGQNKLIGIFVGWLGEMFLGKISLSIDDVIPDGTVKRASSLVIFITRNVTIPVTIIIPSPPSRHPYHHQYKPNRMSDDLYTVLLITPVSVITTSPSTPSSAPQPLDKCRCVHYAVVLSKKSKNNLDPAQPSRTALSLLLLLAKMNQMFTMSQALCKN